MITCEICGKELHYEDNPVATTTGGFICRECIEHYSDRCFCGRVITDKNSLCVCHTSNLDIYNYSYKPRGLFRTKKHINKYKSKQLFLGMELELNHIGDNIIQNLFMNSLDNRDCYLKSDSSIGNGSEVVTAPMSREYMEDWLDSLEDVFSYLNNNSELQENAGMHFHISKSALPIEMIYKLGLLFNTKQMNKVAKVFAYIGGRYKNLEVPCNMHYFQASDNEIRNCLIGEHLYCVNLGGNESKTIEFRFFKSTTDLLRIKDYISLIFYILEYVRITAIKDMNIKHLLEFLVDKKYYKIGSSIKKCLTLDDIDKKIETLTGLRNKIEEISPIFRQNVINNLILLKRTPKNMSALLYNVSDYSPQSRDILNIKNTLSIQWIEEAKKQARETLDLQEKELRRVLCV